MLPCRQSDANIAVGLRPAETQHFKGLLLHHYSGTPIREYFRLSLHDVLPKPVRRSSIPVARPVREPPTIVARFIQYSPSNCADAILTVAGGSQNPQYRVREQLFFESTVGNDRPLKRDLRNPTNAGRCGLTLSGFHFTDEGGSIQIFHAQN